jgi:hypothetical protein
LDAASQEESRKEEGCEKATEEERSDLMTKPQSEFSEAGHDFASLVSAIETIHKQIQAQTAKSVNVSLTVRNWLIGFYISEYELKGADRAEYGERLLDRLAGKLTGLGVSSCQKRRLYGYLRFYQTFPEIVRSLTAQFQNLLPSTALIEGEQKVRSLTAQSLLESLSYTHIEQLIALDSSEKRDFYRSLCINGGWSVRELKRQITSLHQRALRPKRKFTFRVLRVFRGCLVCKESMQ